MKGKRTYIVCAVAIAYLVGCQIWKATPDATVLGILGSLGIGFLRAGIPHR